MLETKSMITLIHGPPGTGKTQTIVGLLDLIHRLDKNPEILLCAPSNGAIDELAFRIMDKWHKTDNNDYFDENENCSKPKIVRIGKSTEKSVNYLVHKCTLENLVNDSKSKQTESDEIKSLKQRIIDKEDLLKKLKKLPKDGKTEPLIAETIQEITKLQKIFDKKMSSSGKGADLIKLENQILDE